MRTATARVGESPGVAPSLRSDDGFVMSCGTRLGPYELLVPIATGGMGRIWAAARTGDFGFRRTFAVKVMREELARDPGFRRMFLEEAKLAARIRHTNVVEVFDLGEAMGTVYQTMALVDGDSLSGLVASASTSSEPIVRAEVAARIVSDALRGLHAAHELRDDDGRPLGLVHRDVSPHNILVGLDGVAKMADFGIAKAVGSVSGSASTGVKGKLGYMAPEQLLDAELDRRADIFSVGVVLWELLACRRTPGFAAHALAGQEVPDPRSIRAHADGSLSEIAMRALSKDPRDRYATAEEMADAIDDAMRSRERPASARAVATWVQALAGARVSERRGEVTRAIARVTEAPEPTILDATAELPTTARSARLPAMRRVVFFTTLVVGATALAVVSLRAGQSSNAADLPTVTATTATAPPAATATASPVLSSIAPNESSTVNEPSPATTRTAGASPTRRPSRASPNVNRPKPTASQAQYDNPYGP